MGGILIFVGVYVLAFPIYFVALRWKKYWPVLYVLTAVLAKIWLFCSGLRVYLRYEEELKKSESYVFCANHTSYLDVPSLLAHKAPMCFVGKSTLAQIPLFGYMYRRMHINVNRASLRSKYNVLACAHEKLCESVNICFFPEGGIRSKCPPQMASFQEGAFRLAIQAKKPLVPVTILYNWMILPKYSPTPFPKIYRHQVSLIFHKPMHTHTFTLKDTHILQARTRDKIEHTLRTYFPTYFSTTT